MDKRLTYIEGRKLPSVPFQVVNLWRGCPLVPVLSRRIDN
jgi:hypothetical protein